MLHSFKYMLKIILRNKPVIFWTLLFPIVLGTLFHFAFSNLASEEELSSFKIGIVKDSNWESESEFHKLIEEMSSESTDVFDPVYYENQESALNALNENEIKGIYQKKDKITLTIADNGMEQTIMKTTLDQYSETSSMVGNILAFDPSKFSMELINKLQEKGYYFKDTTNSNADVTVIYFYTLIAMVCMYGALFGLNVVVTMEANLSKKGARTSIAPTHKLKVLFGSIASSVLVQYVFALILLGYLIYILKIDFGSKIPHILLLMLFGILAGVSLGVLVGVASKKDDNTKSSILLTLIMSGCFLSGMMMVDIKYIVMNYAPILAKINPVSVITDGLYALYYYTDTLRFWENISYLTIFTVIMTLFSYFFLRRKKYDSI